MFAPEPVKIRAAAVPTAEAESTTVTVAPVLLKRINSCPFAPVGMFAIEVKEAFVKRTAPPLNVARPETVWVPRTARLLLTVVVPVPAPIAIVVA